MITAPVSATAPRKRGWRLQQFRGEVKEIGRNQQDQYEAVTFHATGQRVQHVEKGHADGNVRISPRQRIAEGHEKQQE